MLRCKSSSSGFIFLKICFARRVTRGFLPLCRSKAIMEIIAGIAAATHKTAKRVYDPISPIAQFENI